MSLNPEIWGPHYWFVLHTISLTYPKNPNDIIKKKYYKFIQELHLFLPDNNIKKYYINLLNEYPVSPYLDSKDSFIRWVHFIHNIINKKLNKKTISMDEFLTDYYQNYKPKELIHLEYAKKKQKYIYVSIILFLLSISIYTYNK
jgi:hypothetical protein